MALPRISDIAEGYLPGGEHWRLKAGGTAEDYGTFIDVVARQGEGHSGGFYGPLLQDGSVLNSYVGRNDGGAFYMLFRAARIVASLEVTDAQGDIFQYGSVAIDSENDVAFFLMTFTSAQYPQKLRALDSDGNELEHHDVHRPRIFER